MTDIAEAESTGAAPQARAVLHLGFSDPKSPLRVSLPLPPPLRIALVAQIGAHGGTVVEGSLGLSSFHTGTVAAVRMAMEILASGTSLLADEVAPLALRAVVIGIHHDNDGARAAALSRANRILPLARDHTLLLSRDLYEQLDATLSERARLAVPPAWVDSHPDLAGLFDLDWRAAMLHLPEITAVQETLPPAISQERLYLTHGGTQLNLSARDCPITLGRDKSCTVHLDGDVASRVHARIEFAHDKFYLVDESRNGTYLLTPQGEEVFLHQERLPLLGRGVISPGAPIVKQTGEVLRYACRSDDDNGMLAASIVPPPVLQDEMAADHQSMH